MPPPPPPDQQPPKPKVTLEDIVAHKREEIARARSETPLDELKERISELGRPRNFFAAVTKHSRGNDTAIIAEVKRKSPSAGTIRPDRNNGKYDPVGIARGYHANGAAAISCLTDEHFFGGSIHHIHAIRDEIPLPVLRKDFILEPWQVWETRAFGADAVLLIVECLTDAELIDLLILSHQLQLTALVEVHSMDSLLRVRPHVGFPARSYMLLGINNRDLTTMTTDINHTLRLVDLVEEPKTLVSESGISSPEDLARLRKEGVRIALVGESLLRADDPGEALAELLG